MEPLVKSCIPLLRKLYHRTRTLRTADRRGREYFPGFKVFVDTI